MDKAEHEVEEVARGVSKERKTPASADKIFVKMDGCKTLPLDVSPNEKIGDILRRGGRVLRKDAELKSGGVQDRTTVHVARRMRGGGRHKDKKRKGSAKNEERKDRAPSRSGRR